jgi:hypothetical protein
VITLRVLACFAALVILLPAAAAAQDWSMPWLDPRDRPPRVDFNASAGLLVPTDWSDLVLLGSVSSASGVLEQTLVRDLHVEPGTVFGAAVTYWQSKYGFRVHVARSRSSLLIGDDDSASVNLDTWFYDVRGAIGLVEYSPTRRVWPYAFIGFGGITYDLARTVSPPLLTFIQRGPVPDGQGDLVIVADDGRQFLLVLDEMSLETVFAINLGAGTDLRIPLGPAGIGLRLEVSDHIAPSPVGLRIHELGRFGAFPATTAVRFRWVHHMRAAAGLVVQLGR